MPNREESAAPSLRVRGVVETCLYVDDVAAAARFYEQVLGLVAISRNERMASIPVVDRQMLLLFERGGSRAGFEVSGGSIPGHDGEGPVHLGLAVEAKDLPAWEARLHDHGVAVEARVHWPRGGRSLYFRDPDDHLLELLSPGVWTVY